MEDNKLNVIITPEAEDDIVELCNYIAFDVMAHNTAIRYYIGIYDTIKKLSVVGAMLPVSQQRYLRKRYGEDVRTISYKNTTIVYNIIGNVVYVRRVTASSLIR